jgi:hypothetical protein
LLVLTLLMGLGGCSSQEESCSSLTQVRYSGIGTLEIQSDKALVHYEAMGREHADWLIVPPDVPIEAPLDTLSGHEVLFEGLKLEMPAKCGYTGQFSQALRITRLAVVTIEGP